MNSDMRRFALAGLAISILALITGIGVLIALGLTSVGLFTPSKPELINQIGYASLAGFVVGLAIYAMLDPEKTREMLTGRQMQYGSNAVIMLLAFIGILIAVNVIVYQNPVKWDWTEDRSNTLSPETLDTLTSLTEPVVATAFYTGRLNPEGARTLLENFKSHSNGNFNYQFIDPETNPVASQNAGVNTDGQIVLETAGRKQIAEFATEQELLSAMLRLMNPTQSVIYFLSGHGEHDATSSGDQSYSRLAESLRNKNYDVRELNLLTENTVPADAQVMIISGPLTPITEGEITLIDAYLASGGSLIVMQDPVAATQFGDATDYMGDYLSQNWGISFNNDIIIDPSSNSPLVAIAYQYGLHPITQKMQDIASAFPVSRSLTISTEPIQGVSQTDLVQTIDRSWGETDFNSIENNLISYDEGQDIPGPLSVMAAAENFASNARVVVFGNSTFAEDINFDFSGNSKIIMNAIDWAAEQENLINLSPNATTERQFVPPNNLSLISMLLLSVCIIPLGIIGLGFSNWITRRRRG